MVAYRAQAHRGLIPARAGKTWNAATSASHTGAHPRACGENLTGKTAEADAAGSSPRVRGKLGGGLAGRLGLGLIPARAGKTLASTQSRSPGPAHPRACGENMSNVPDPEFMPGSSPRVRGKHPRIPDHGGTGRLIPARAGKTQQWPSTSAPSRAHPRACGENFLYRRRGWCRWGSSPRVRGKRLLSRRRIACPGLIPARAGKTGPTPGRNSPSRAHPRACGENALSSSVGAPVSGSSPRVRGKRGGDGEDAGLRGLIPARAGKTSARPRPTPPARAHPRACGENFGELDADTAAPGSSPRVRGKRSRQGRRRRFLGLIPARAGKTTACSWTSATPTGSSPRVRGKHGPHRRQGGP